MTQYPARPPLDTLMVHGGEPRPPRDGSVVFPVYQGTVFAFAPGTGYHDIQYLRLNNTPGQKYLHDKLAAIEGAQAAVATASGMAALTTTLLAVLAPGDHVLAGDCLYGGTHDFLTHQAPRLGWSCSFVDMQRPETWTHAVRPETRLFLAETITNPLMRVPRLEEMVAFARGRRLLTLIDNTFASPMNFRPLAHGFDLVFHSATKYLNGHSDIVAGAVMGGEELITRVRHTLDLFGGSLDPHAGFLLARGIKTLGVRMRAQNATALALAGFLSTHEKVQSVNYPGLHRHPDHDHAKALLSGFGGMLSFRLKGGAAAVERFLAALQIPYVAPSLGGVESLAIQPALTSHAGMTREDRERIGVTEDLVRMSCGIEAEADLIEDVERALAAA